MSSASTLWVTFARGYPLFRSRSRRTEGSHLSTATSPASGFLSTWGRRCPNKTARGGSRSRSLRRMRAVSTSAAPFGARELMGMGDGSPISLATIGLTVFFPVPGVPQTPTIPRTTDGGGAQA